MLIGLGASAIGKLPQGFVQNAPDLGGYTRTVGNGEFPIAKGLALSDEDRLRGSIIERLMCDLALDLDIYGGVDRFANEFAELQPLANEGLIEIEGACIRMSEMGRPFVRIAATAFDSYLAAGQKRHSVAV